MPLIKSTNLNVDLIRNLPEEMKNELITLNDVIPDRILASLCVNKPSFKEKRHDFIEKISV